MSVYAVSDLHGQYEVFLKGLKKIGFSEDDRLYFIGDAVDRGPDGIKILQLIKDHGNMDLIIGNHEFMMLNSVDPEGKKKCNGADANLWLYYNGGTRTYEKYGNLSDKARLELLTWLKDSCVMKTIEVNGVEFCLTHSYYKQGFENMKYSEMEYRDVWEIVWKSHYRSDSNTYAADIYKDYDFIFITGHVPVQKASRRFNCTSVFKELRIFEKGNYIDIDGGCAMGAFAGMPTGALFLRLDDMKVFPVPLMDDELF